jgi:hypothetical protein
MKAHLREPGRASPPDTRIPRLSIEKSDLTILPETEQMWAEADRAQNELLLDLFAEDSWRSVYAGELEVRPPGAPTTAPD